MKHLVLLIFLILFSCDIINNDTKSKMELLKIEYTQEELNYFYETVFFEDFGNKKISNLKKWDTDIVLFYFGDFSERDELIIVNTIKQINKLDLPIKIKIAEKENQANVELFFGNRTSVLKRFGQENKFGVIQGYASTNQENGIIRSGEIGIINDLKAELRDALIFEELVQILGLQGDSHSYRSSTFYEKENYVTELSELDSKIIQLLYDQRIPHNYSIEKFEDLFSKELYSINSKNKLFSYLNENETNTEVLRTIRDYFFINDSLFKYSKNIPIYITDNNFVYDSLLLDQNIKIISEELNIEIFLNDKASKRTYDGIFIEITETPNLDKDLMQTLNIELGKGMHPKIVKTEVLIQIKEETNNDEENITTSIINGIVKSIGPLYLNRDVINDEGKIDKKYLDALRLVYSDIIPDGYSLKEFDELFIEYINYKNEDK